MIISPLRAFMATPFTSMLTNSSAIAHLRRLSARPRRKTAAAVVDHVFKLVPIVLEEPLPRPCRGIPERADRVPLDAVCNVDEEIQILPPRRAAEHAQE